MAKAVIRFLVHQLISAEVLTLICTLSISSLFSIFGASNRQASGILTELVGFPIQVVFALIIGFVLWRRRQDMAMMWVWVVPTLILCTVATFILCVRGSSLGAVVAHFLGNACHPSDHCFDQLVFTLPCLTSAAYAAGAFLASNLKSGLQERETRVR